MRTISLCCLALLFAVYAPAAHAGGYTLYDYDLIGAGNILTFQLLSVPVAGLHGNEYPFSTGWDYQILMDEAENSLQINKAPCSAPTIYSECALLHFYILPATGSSTADFSIDVPNSLDLSFAGVTLLDNSNMPLLGTFNLMDGTTPYTLTVNVDGATSAPEPSTLLLLSTGLLGLAGVCDEGIQGYPFVHPPRNRMLGWALRLVGWRKFGGR